MGPGLNGEADPAHVPLEVSLNVRLLGVGDFTVVTRRATDSIGNTSGIHSGRGAPKVLEQGSFVILVNHTVPLEHDASLVLTVLVTLRQLRVLKHTNAKKVSELNLFLITSRLGGDDVPLHDSGFVPNVFVTKALPFCIHGRLSRWDLLNLLAANGLCHGYVERKDPRCNLVAVLPTTSVGFDARHGRINLFRRNRGRDSVEGGLNIVIPNILRVFIHIGVVVIRGGGGRHTRLTIHVPHSDFGGCVGYQRLETEGTARRRVGATFLRGLGGSGTSRLTGPRRGRVTRSGRSPRVPHTELFSLFLTGLSPVFLLGTRQRSPLGVRKLAAGRVLARREPRAVGTDTILATKHIELD
jgi:hypothetical protein